VNINAKTIEMERFKWTVYNVIDWLKKYFLS